MKEIEYIGLSRRKKISFFQSNKLNGRNNINFENIYEKVKIESNELINCYTWLNKSKESRIIINIIILFIKYFKIK